MLVFTISFIFNSLDLATFPIGFSLQNVIFNLCCIIIVGDAALTFVGDVVAGVKNMHLHFSLHPYKVLDRPLGIAELLKFSLVT